MKIAITSDVHLEFGDLILKNEENADVLILSGDICVAADFRKSDPYGIVSYGKTERYTDFFIRCANEFKNVIYVAGNHEHYNGDYAETFTILRKYLGSIPNLHILDKEHVTIDDVTFIGGTLWTDMNAQDPVTLAHIRGIMNDFRIIQNSTEMVSYKTMVNAYDADGNVKLDANGLPIQKAEFHKRPARFTPQDTVQDHKKMLEESAKCVVVCSNDHRRLEANTIKLPSKI
jgi:Icc-related predicted phosphoesterase